ncbi:SGNH/GDSL hydrolase family protein, partial [Massilia eurypsychrophila]
MPNLAASSFAASSGQRITRGRAPAPWAGDWITLGDSLTDILYSIESTRYGFARSLVPPRVIWNAGIQSEGAGSIGARLPALVAAFPSVKNYAVRAGTNGGTEADFTAMIDFSLSAGVRLMFLALPPRGSGATAVSTFVARNAWLAARCAANPSTLRFIDDSAGLAADANYNANVAFAPDYIHQNAFGVYLQGEAQRAGMAAVLPTT